MKRFYFFLLVLVFTGGLLAGCRNKAETSGAGGKDGPAGSNWFSDLDTEDIDGNKVTKEIFAGKKVTLINVWATFCSPCIGEMPELDELYQEYKDGPVGIVGILIDSSGVERIPGLTDGERELGKTILKKTGVTYPQLTPSEALINTDFKRIIEFPTTFFVDEDGNFVGQPVTGAKTKKQWKEIIEERLEQAENKES